MASHNGDVFVSGIRALMLRNETACADHIEGCDTKKALGVVYSFRFEDLGTDRYSAVDGVRDHENICVRGGVCDGFGEVTDDGGIGVEEICR